MRVHYSEKPLYKCFAPPMWAKMSRGWWQKTSPKSAIDHAATRVQLQFRIFVSTTKLDGINLATSLRVGRLTPRTTSYPCWNSTTRHPMLSSPKRFRKCFTELPHLRQRLHVGNPGAKRAAQTRLLIPVSDLGIRRSSEYALLQHRSFRYLSCFQVTP